MANPTAAERLTFVVQPREDLRACNIVSALVGVTTALDLGVVARDPQHERDTAAYLATASRILAEQLQARLT